MLLLVLAALLPNFYVGVLLLELSVLPAHCGWSDGGIHIAGDYF